MTGFGTAQGTVAGGALRIEVKSVNHRYLSLSLKGPNEVMAFESEIRDRLRRDVERGHLTISVRWVESPSKPESSMQVDVEKARAAVARLRDLATAVGLSDSVTLELLARQPDVFAFGDETAAPTVEWAAIEPILGTALQGLSESRRREGATLGAELSERVRLIRVAAQAVAAKAPERVTRERDRLRGAVAQLLDGRAVEEQRLAQEIAFLAERLDITEEMVRLEAHLVACEQAIGSARSVGKQLGFLAQELGREVNTIGSKANDAAIQHLAVEMKGELERFREQLENLE